MPRGNALSMAHQSSVGWACGWLVSAVFWPWIEEKLWFPWPFSKRKMKCACTFGWGAPATFSESAKLSCACPIFRCEKFAGPTRYACQVVSQPRHDDLKCALSRCSWLSPRAFARAGYVNQDWFPCIARRHRSIECLIRAVLLRCWKGIHCLSAAGDTSGRYMVGCT